MGSTKKKAFFTSHAKSSAVAVSLVVHAIIFIMAIAFVAVTVIRKEDTNFEAKKVKRPRMQLKKLHVPVNVKKKKQQKPKLRKRIVVKPQEMRTPEIKLPEIAGVKGGMGSAGDGLGGGGSIGFSMPEINIFGIKSRGEKIFLILDTGSDMLRDERGGIPAYTIIKNELLNIVGEIPPTTLFNIAVYGKNDTYMLFPNLMPATQVNVEQAEAWLGPLNVFKEGMGDKEYGAKTLGSGGRKVSGSYVVEPLKNNRFWVPSAMIAMEQQADAVYVLTGGFGTQRYLVEAGNKKNKGKEKVSDEEDSYTIAKRKFDEENDQRRKKGMPPRVFGSRREMIKHYVGLKSGGGTGNEYYNYTTDDIVEAMMSMRSKHASSRMPLTSGINKSKDRFSFNVIHFIETGKQGKDARFKDLAGDLRGDYRTLAGLEAIQFSASQPQVDDVAMQND